MATAGLGYVGAGGQRFQSSALARGSLGGTTTRANTPAETAKWYADRGLAAPGVSGMSGVSAVPTASTGPSVSPEARTALQSAMDRYAPGGGFGAGIEAGLERGRVKSVASGMQNLVSSGLANTTMAGGLGKKYEEEVAAPTRANMEETRASAIASLQAMLAQMEQGGYQASLGRGFQASQSALDRQFTADQSMLNRPQPSISSYSPPAYSAPAPRTVAQEQSNAQTLPTLPNVMDSVIANNAVRANTGSQSTGQNWATINGVRWVQDAEGKWVKG